MKVKYSMIESELRTTGRFIKIINNTFTESRLGLFNKLMKKYRMKVKDDTMQFVEELIPRKDGLKMRICIFKPLKTEKNVPGILWLHGEDYALGAPEQAQCMAKRFIEEVIVLLLLITVYLSTLHIRQH